MELDEEEDGKVDEDMATDEAGGSSDIGVILPSDEEQLAASTILGGITVGGGMSCSTVWAMGRGGRICTVPTSAGAKDGGAMT